MKKNIIKIILSDSDERFRKILKAYLKTFKFIEIIAEIGNIQELIKISAICYCDIILMEIKTPVEDYMNVIKTIKKKCPKAKIIALMNLDWEESICKIMGLGIKQIVLRYNGNTEVVSAINSAAKSKFYFCEEIVDYLTINSIKKNNGDLLTKREDEILQYIASGKSIIQIANHLNISTKTVSTHKTNLHSKTNTENDVELINYARENFLLK